MLTSATHQLSRQEVEMFHQQGYLGPYAVCSPEEMAEIRTRIERVITLEGPNPRSKVQSRHMDQRIVYELASHPAIVERINDLMGPDLVLWATNFFIKYPGDKEIPWHQDLNYWPIDPPINISAWIAIDEATKENSCVNIIPGSHKKVLQHVKSTEGMQFQQMADPHAFDATSNVLSMELKPGEFFLFSERLLHQSFANTSQKRRIGMTGRYTVPWVKIDHDRGPLHPGHSAILLRGTDHHKINRSQNPPVA